MACIRFMMGVCNIDVILTRQKTIASFVAPLPYSTSAVSTSNQSVSGLTRGLGSMETLSSLNVGHEGGDNMKCPKDKT